MMRVFCAIEIPSEIRDQAAQHIKLLRDSFPRARASWERAAKMHLTLKFLGEITEKQLEKLNLAVINTTNSFQTFAISIENTGAFPPRGVPRVLWLGVNDSTNALTTSQNKLEDECAKTGFKKEMRLFHPHLTLARLRSPESAKELKEKHESLKFKSASFTVSEIVIMQSELAPTGSRYTKLYSHQLK